MAFLLMLFDNIPVLVGANTNTERGMNEGIGRGVRRRIDCFSAVHLKVRVTGCAGLHVTHHDMHC